MATRNTVVIVKNRLRGKICNNCWFFDRKQDIHQYVNWANACKHIFHSSAIPRETTCMHWKHNSEMGLEPWIKE